MAQAKKKNPAQKMINEISALKEQFDGIKVETEDFIKNLKRVSGSGAADAKELMEAAKKNWHSIVSAFEASPIAKFFGKAKKSAKKTAKKIAKKKKK